MTRATAANTADSFVGLINVTKSEIFDNIFTVNLYLYIYQDDEDETLIEYMNDFRSCPKRECAGEVGGWGRDPKKCTGRDWGMGSSTIYDGAY